MDTANGKPSGIATIKMTTAVIKTRPIFKRVSLEKNSFLSDKNIKIAAYISYDIRQRNVPKIAYFSIPLASMFNFCSRTVFYSCIFNYSGLLDLARSVFSPTQHTIALP